MSGRKTNMEDEANIFAMHLLMPTDLLRREIGKLRYPLAIDDDKAISKLAGKFKVPISVMAIRLGMLMQDGNPSNSPKQPHRAPAQRSSK